MATHLTNHERMLHIAAGDMEDRMATKANDQQKLIWYDKEKVPILRVSDADRRDMAPVEIRFLEDAGNITVDGDSAVSFVTDILRVAIKTGGLRFAVTTEGGMTVVKIHGKEGVPYER